MKTIVPVILLLVVMIFAGCKKDNIDGCPGYETEILGNWSRVQLEKKDFSGNVVSNMTWNKNEVVYEFLEGSTLNITDPFTQNTQNIYVLSDTCNTILTIDVTESYTIRLMNTDSMHFNSVENGLINNYYFIR